MAAVHFRAVHGQSGVPFPLCLFRQERVTGITTDRKGDVTCPVCALWMKLTNPNSASPSHTGGRDRVCSSLHARVQPGAPMGASQSPSRTATYSPEHQQANSVEAHG